MENETPLLCEACRTCPVHALNRSLAARLRELEQQDAEAKETKEKPRRRRGGIE